MESEKLPKTTEAPNVLGEAWVLIVNNENKYEPLKVNIIKVIPSNWNKEKVDYGVEYEKLGRIVRVRVPDTRVYFTEWRAIQMAQHLNEEYD